MKNNFRFGGPCSFPGYTEITCPFCSKYRHIKTEDKLKYVSRVLMGEVIVEAKIFLVPFVG